MRVNTLVHAVCIVAACFLTAEAGTAQTLPCYPRTSYHLQQGAQSPWLPFERVL